MPLKYPNKKKRRGYWKIYDRARIKDFRKVWNFAKQIVEEQGNPYKKKDNREKPNLSYLENAVVCIMLDEEYVYEAARKLGAKIEAMFNDGCYIVDSTEYTTTRYYELIDAGKRTIGLFTLKLHILIRYINTFYGHKYHL